jgi:hypothetical protein
MKRIFVAALVGLGTYSAAGAQEPYPPVPLPPAAYNPAVRSAWAQCQPDIAEFCDGIVPGGGRIVRCLVANIEDISPQCRDGIHRARAALGY